MTVEANVDSPRDRSEKDVVEIPTSRIRLLKTLLTCLVFIAMGSWLVIEKPAVWKFPPEGAFLVGIFVTAGSILLFAIVLVRLVDIRPALILDRHGLIDQTTAMGVGRVEWSDVLALRWMRARPRKKFNWQRGGRVLAIDVVDPEVYLRRASPVAKWLMMKPSASWYGYGTPVFVHLITLKVDAERLEYLVEQFSGITAEHQEHSIVTL